MQKIESKGSYKMRLYTKRLKEMSFSGAIDEQLLKLSMEYRALAILKYLFPNRYENVVHNDRPDLQGEKIGIEVTVADSSQDMRVNKEFLKFCDGSNREVRKKTIEQDEHYQLLQVQGIDILSAGGGMNLVKEKEKVQAAIKNKIESVKRYPNNPFQTMELFILITEIPSLAVSESIIEWINEEMERDQEEIFDRIYVFARRHCYYCERYGSAFNRGISKEDYQMLSRIGRATAENRLSLEDEEWGLEESTK